MVHRAIEITFGGYVCFDRKVADLQQKSVIISSCYMIKSQAMHAYHAYAQPRQLQFHFCFRKFLPAAGGKVWAKLKKLNFV